MNQVKRVAFEVALSIIILVLFFSGLYEAIPAPMQLLSMKVVLVSVGMLHAHAMGKLFFPAVDWKGKLRPAHFVRIMLYAIIPLCYAFGG
ncbi:hypothetical protein [Sulfuricurvum sp.]|uniref:hypothetical protein n=1 Tax=Sulfuricurvum sp. TaxID=2025608 RepID=UPI0026099C28|nr:hypothetical protein [Sulfuricurvum sp.]MDD2267461.1 hypothetical protein [Sulfuricurvum sp.]MDD2782817.1 hypothetical protein [Sulfuricurvum sp.]